MTTRRNLLISASILPFVAACGGGVEGLKTTAKEVAHDAITSAARDIATIGEAFAKKVLPELAQKAGAAVADQAKAMLGSLAQDALAMAQAKTADVATGLMQRASSVVENVVQLVKSKVAASVNTDQIIQAAMSLLPVAKSTLGMLVPPMAGAMSPDQARAVLRSA